MFAVMLSYIATAGLLLTVCASYELVVTPGGPRRFSRPVSHSLSVGCQSKAGKIQPVWSNDRDEAITAASGRVFVTDDGSKRVLHITSITADDAGDYTCRGDSNTVVTVSLTVHQLQIRPHGEQFIKPLNSSSVFTCEVQQFGEESADVSVRWLGKDRNEIKDVAGRVYIERETSSLLKLYITSIREEDDKYTCVGSVDGDTSEKTVQLLSFKEITFDDAPNPQHPAIYSDALLKCVVSGRPKPDVTWRYKGRRVVTRGRYEVIPGVGLRISNVTEADNGVYTCRAEVESDGRFDERKISVVVHIPPVISDTESAVDSVVGREKVVQCRASGLPLPTYQFYRADSTKPIASSKDVEVDQVRGTMTFKSIRKSDAGRYICNASNDVGFDKQDINMRVLIPAEVVEFNNVSQTEFGFVKLICKVQGDPSPNVTLYRVHSYGGVKEPLEILYSDSGRMKLSSLPDRTELTISNLTVDDAGAYVCQTANSIGVDEKTATITVNYKPRFTMYQNAIFYSWAGKTLNISCNVRSHPAPTIEWQHNSITLSNNATYQLYHSNLASHLQVTATKADEDWIYGDYICRASNYLGSNSYPLQLAQAKVPDPPQDIRIRENSPDLVIFEVIPPADGTGLEILGYRVEYERYVYDFTTGGDGSGPLKQNTTTEYSNEVIRLENLRPSTTYVLHIGAKNEVGVGKLIERNITTANAREPYPIQISSSTVGTKPTEYLLTWEKPRTGGSPITSYEIKYRQVKMKPNGREIESPHPEWVKLSIKDGRTLMQYQLNNLYPNTFYEVHVTASNRNGPSKPSSSFIFRTLSGEPIKVAMESSYKTALAIVGAILITLLLIVGVLCFYKNGCIVHFCGQQLRDSNSSFKKEKELEEGECKEMLKEPEVCVKVEAEKTEATPDHVTRSHESEESQLEQETAAVVIPPEEEEDKNTVTQEDDSRRKNRRSVLSQGDERWKDIVQELEIRQQGRKKLLSEEEEDGVFSAGQRQTTATEADYDETAPLTQRDQQNESSAARRDS